MLEESRDPGTVLAEVDWEAMHPRLITHALAVLRRVRWLPGTAHEAAKMAAGDVVNTAIERYLSGQRRWSPAYPDLESFLRGTIDSIVNSAKKSDVRQKTDSMSEDTARLPDPSADAQTALEAEQRHAATRKAIEACVGDDPMLQDLYLAMLEGHVKRDDIARSLGWSGEQVSAARVKLRRRLNSSSSETSLVSTIRSRS